MSKTRIKVSGLRKSFGDVVAVDGISFDVMDGELFGFLGPNGAGKTTTINMLTGLARPDAGTITVGGIDCAKKPKSAQHLIGVVPDESNLYPELSGYDNLCFCGGLYGMRLTERKARAGELLELFGLAGVAERRFSGYSRGMKRRLTIAAGIMHSPPILFLDEPTTGIDVQSARLTREVLQELHRSGTTIFLTTHYIEEAERMCDRIAFMVNGLIVRVDSVNNLLKPVEDREVVQVSVLGPEVPNLKVLGNLFPDYSIDRAANGGIRIESTGKINVGAVVRLFEDQGFEVAEVKRTALSLEDVFVRVTGLKAGVMDK
ncbi:MULTISPECIES: ABC transporter ATP-binding protein [Prosthecochloris]|uniref:ABC transporter n=1 Tax=Prosthecochloris marina TaxID=2017681 RepID=A0A317T7Z8_9CHLB|nr:MULTISPECIES: ABC transporter ATP-binding protein [Prosthecochloris]PWW82440.1 ABC transporter [Prosthecochloris marina]UZJ37422.1 ABC transporter ATP-binding protein [Prosthecochloris sp. SCSIO W1103]UZJ39244.1 ABC transporter ATP-binding protein [Prosthecochloris sp. SCSIO W1102]